MTQSQPDQRCPICQNPARSLPLAGIDAREVQCSICGTYNIMGAAEELLRHALHSLRLALMAFVQTTTARVTITQALVESYM